MKKKIILIFVAIFSIGAFAQVNTKDKGQKTYVNIIQKDVFSSKERSKSNLFYIDKKDIKEDEYISCYFYDKETDMVPYTIELEYFEENKKTFYEAIAIMKSGHNDIISTNTGNNLKNLLINLEVRKFTKKKEIKDNRSIIMGSKSVIKDVLYNIDSNEKLNFNKATRLYVGFVKEMTLLFKNEKKAVLLVCE